MTTPQVTPLDRLRGAVRVVMLTRRLYNSDIERVLPSDPAPSSTLGSPSQAIYSINGARKQSLIPFMASVEPPGPSSPIVPSPEIRPRNQAPIATIGGLLLVDNGRLLGLTVKHLFNIGSKRRSATEGIGSQRASISSVSESSSDENSTSVKSVKPATSMPIPQMVSEVKLKKFIVETIAEDDDLKEDCKVCILTPRSHTSESKQTTCQFQEATLTNKKSIEPDWRVNVTTGSLRAEDCGSWVIMDNDTHALIGIIWKTPANNEGNLFHMAPAKNIMKEIKAIFPNARLPTRRESESHDERSTTIKLSQEDNPMEPEKEESSVSRLFSRLFLRTGKSNELHMAEPRLEGSFTALSQIRFGQQSLPAKYKESFSKDSIVVDGLRIWTLGDKAKEDWENIIRPRVRSIILRDPVQSRTALSPMLSLYGLMVGKTKDRAMPTVMIATMSPTARKQLLKAIRESGVLESEKFEVMAVNVPLRTLPQA
ncbi:hypothetical protein B7494_g3971 [Chlorociboria aeruginascens]|nr:hypothetical protein B7494_g3971 [Chlorociboria aeruginascens]